MIVHNTKYYCDYCEKEISEEEYKMSASISLVIDLPYSRAHCAERCGTSLELCRDCSKSIGIVTDEGQQAFNYITSRLTGVLENNKKKILSLFKKKK